MASQENTLSPEQVVFTLKSVGKYWMHANGEGLPGESLTESFLQEIQNSVGQLASKLAITYGLRYNGEQIILERPPSLQQVQLAIQSIGARVPPDYRRSSAEAMKYLQDYGKLYLPFTEAQTTLSKTQWKSAVSDLLFVDMPMVSGADAYLNLYLETHLRDLYTDFDIFNLFPKIRSELANLSNRNEMISYLVKFHHPGGFLWISFGFTSIQLLHHWNQLKSTYRGPDAIRSTIFDGTMYLKDEPVPHIILYQLAFLVRPSYAKRIYGTDASDIVLDQMENIYTYVLEQIKIAEARGEQKVRFSNSLREFNADLNT
jgi:hypothetical protein